MNELTATAAIELEILATAAITSDSPTAGGGGDQVIRLNQAVTPSPDGATKDFSTPHNFAAASLIVVLNGQELAGGLDYTVTASNAFRFADDVDAPEASDALWVHYEQQ